MVIQAEENIFGGREENGNKIEDDLLEREKILGG
jgi:hypothetical protein